MICILRSVQVKIPADQIADSPEISLILLPFPKRISEFLQRTPNQLSLLPKVGCEEAISIAYSDKGCLKCIFEGLGRARGRGVYVRNSSQLQQPLDSRGSNQTRATRSRNKLCPISTRYTSAVFLHLRTLTRTVTLPHFPLSLQGSE